MNNDMQRLFAFGADAVICYGIYKIVSFVLSLLSMLFFMKLQQDGAAGMEEMILLGATGILIFLGSLFFVFLYFVIPTAIWGKTLGKLIFRVTVEYHSNPPGFLRASTREFLKLVQWVFFLIPIFALYQLLEYGHTWYDQLLGLQVRCDAFGLTETQKNWRKLHDRRTPAKLDARKKWPLWKVGLLMGSIAVFSIVCFGGAAYFIYQKHFAPSTFEVALKPLSEAEHAALQKAFDRLEAALKEHAPVLLEKRKPLPPEQLETLRNSLNGKTIEPLEMWYAFFAGLEEYEIIPTANPVELDFALETRRAGQRLPLRLQAPQRARSMMLLQDEYNGYSLLLTEEQGSVYYDIARIDTMTKFVNMIAESIEKKFWTYNPNGELIESEFGTERFWALRSPPPRSRKFPGYY